MRSLFKVKAGPLLKAPTWLLFSALSGCGGDLASPEHGIGPTQVPSREDFGPVSDAMQLKCGTLDCHGQMGRNLRLFGHYGLRLGDLDPFEPPTTEEEYDASYWSVVGLEPEMTTKVVRKERPPLDLAFVRKPRNIEKHKGYQLMSKGDPLDRCLVSWLLVEFDADACKTVIETPRPEPDGGQ